MARSSIVGLTGGIGSGKSTVARVFSMIGIPVWDADLAGQHLYSENQELQQWVVKKFGKSCGEWSEGNLLGINRKELASIVFNDRDSLMALNQKVHPLIREIFTKWHEWNDQFSSSPYVIRESAILFESNSHMDCSQVISVEAKEPLRIKRATKRDKWNIEDVEARISRQMQDIERTERSDYVIQNNANDALLQQVMHIHNSLSQSLL